MTPSTAAAGIMIQIARGGCSRLDELGERRRGHDAVAAQRFGFGRIVRVADALVPIPEPAARHVRAHPAETDETELHGTAPLVVLRATMPQPKVARRRAATVVDSEHGRQGELMSSVLRATAAALVDDGAVDAASRAIGAARRAARFRGGSIGRAADGRLADEWRQSLQPALFAAEPNQHDRTSRSSKACGARGCAARASRRSTRAKRSRSCTTASRTSARARTTCSRCRSTPARFFGSTRPISSEDLPSVCCGWNNRGVALSEDKVFMGRLDGKLVALDRKSGAPVWTIQAERIEENFSITPAPVYFDGLVITGFAGADRGTRGRVKAYDARRRQARLDVLRHTGARRAWARDLAAGQRLVEVRRRRGVADAGHRSRARPRLFLDG